MFSDLRRKIFVSCAGLLTGMVLSLLAQIHAQQPARGNSPQPARQEVVMENASRIVPPPQVYHFPLGTTFYYKGDRRPFSARAGSLMVGQDPLGQHHGKATVEGTRIV